MQFSTGDATLHSFLDIGNGFQIDNAFYFSHSDSFRDHDYIRFRQSIRQLDEDPGTTNLPVNIPDTIFAKMFKFEGVGREKLRLVCTPDEKMEQKLAYETTFAFRCRWVIYDLNMRHYIKTKYGVVIPSLAEKWHRLCWHCFNPGDNLKCCSKCKIAQYCTKNCQKLDWEVHKEVHGVQAQIDFENKVGMHYH